jgi:hypothetical protein
MKEQQIYFIKNGTTYVLIFDAPENTFDKEKSNFDYPQQLQSIINSQKYNG